MNISEMNTQPLAPQSTAPATTPVKSKTTEEVLKSSQQFLEKNKLQQTQRAYDVKVETPSSKTGRTIEEKSVAISALQTADQGMATAQDTLKKMSSIVEKAADKTLTAKDREGLQKEYDDLQKQLDKNSESTNYNGHKLLDGKFELETNTSNNRRLNREISIGSMSSEGLGLSKISLASAEEAAAASKKLKAASETIETERKAVSAEQKTLTKEVSDLTQIKDFQTKKNDSLFNLKKVESANDFDKLLEQMKKDMFTQAFDVKNNLNSYNTSRMFSLLF